MNKQQAQEQISGVFQHTFDRERYTAFLRNLLNHYEPRDGHYTGNLIPDAFKPHVTQYWRVGKYIDPEGDEMDLLVVEVPSLNKLERARSALRNFAVNRLKQFDKDSSLVAFYARDDGGADWRFSFVKIEHEAYKDEKGKVKLRQELTPAKRYSYLVGEHENSHTACKQLLPLLEMDYADPRVHDIEAAFGIEKVTDEFFAQYKGLFQSLGEHLKQQPWFQRSTDDERDQLVTRFAKKLLGQIVFLYFLQKKGWLGVPENKRWGEGPKRFMRERFDQVAAADGNYYHDFLQYLFYEALADERRDAADPGYYKRLDCRIPFLNGGLFEADYDWRNETIDIPNHIFHNREKTRAGDDGTGILDVFDRYNFTIKEDEPLEKEVAVDPEMLGKVFENMLEVTERKSKGAFYTPREIVHYMCQESLVHYLDNRLNQYGTGNFDLGAQQGNLFGNDQSAGQLNMTESGDQIRVPKADIETLIRKGRLALDNDTRVLGKGRETETYKFQLPESVRRHARDLDAALAGIKVCDPAIGSGAFPVGLLHEIVNTRLALAPHSENAQSPYDFKRHAIAESIYGVDIDASAIDIARLRLWLSMIVDEDDYGAIEPLPNLDYKIVRGNSLIGFPEDWNSPAFTKIEDLKKQFFEETDHERKTELKNSIDDAIEQRLEVSEKVFGYKVDFDFRLFFSEVWHDNEGFDIVIGNPPYGVYQGKRKDELKIIKKIELFKKAKGRKLNAFELFLCLPPYLLRYGGNLAFIFQNSFLADSSASKLREFYFKQMSILTIDSFPERDDVSKRVFRSAKMSVCILQAQKVSSKEKYELRIWKDKHMTSAVGCIQAPEKNIALDPKNFSIPMLKENEYGVLELLSDNKKISYEWHCFEGEINLTAHKRFLRDSPCSDCFKMIKGASVQRWRIADKMSQGKDQFVHKDYLRECSRSPKSLHHQRDRVVLQGITGVDERYRLKAARLTKGIFCGNSANYILLDKEYELDAMVALLNSEVMEWFFRKYSTNANVNGYEVDNFPIPQGDLKALAAASAYVQFLEQDSANCQLESNFFRQLSDAVVYDLYFNPALEAAGKEILPHLGELTPISDDMSDEQKLAVIQREFDRLYDPNHPVRNRIETLDSVDVVRTIRGALKR